MSRSIVGLHVSSAEAIIVAVIVATTILIGLAERRSGSTLTGFALANKSLGPWLLAFSIMATYFSAASFLGGGGATYLYNLGFGAWLTAWHVIGVVALWVLVADKLFEYAARYRVMSIPDLLEVRYSSRAVRVTASIIIVVLFTLYLVSVYKGGAIVLSSQLGVDVAVALLILAVPVVIYVVVSGMRGAALNNLFLGAIMLAAAALTFYYIMSYVGGPLEGLRRLSQTEILGKPGTMWLRLDGAGPQPVAERGLLPLLIMSITFSIGMAQVALPNLLIQFYAAKSREAVAKGRLVGPLLVALYAALMFSLGAFCHLVLDDKLHPQEVLRLMRDPDWVIPRAISLLAPPLVRGFILAAPVAASMSTIAVTVLTISNSLIGGLLRVPPAHGESRRHLLAAKAAAAAFAVLPIPLVLIESRLIVELVGAAFGTIFACFVGPVTVGLHWSRATKEAALASMIVGAVTGLAWYIYLYRRTWIYPTLPAAALSLLTFALLSLVKAVKAPCARA